MRPGPLLSVEQIETDHRDGSLLVKRMFNPEEIGLLLRSSREDRALDQHSFGKADGEGGRVRLSLWNHPGDGIDGMFARCRRVVDSNGCLQVIPGSHRLGRIEPVLTGEQAGADLERVEKVLERLPLVDVEMDPGDALFFHSNLLHRSDRNTSPDPRWSLICCYNPRHNDPYKNSHHLRYTPLSTVDDPMIREVGVKRFADDPSDVAWLDPVEDASSRSLARDSPG